MIAGVLAALLLLGPGASAEPAAPGEVTRFADPEITEASGLVVAGGLLVTVNDSGDTGRVLVVDPADGRTVGTTTWAGDPVDVEALAPGAGRDGVATVWVGDIGDNRATRDGIEVREVPVGRGERTASGPSFALAYPDRPHDAESLLRDPATGRLLVATKGLLGGTLYRAPAALDPDGPNALEEVGPVLPLATDGAFLTDLPGGPALVLRDYTRAVVYSWPALEPVASTVLPRQEQGEAIAADSASTDPRRVLVTSEGAGAAVLAVDLDLGPLGASPSPSSSPTASATRAPTESREDRELPETRATERSSWPWLLGGAIGLGALAVLLRSLRDPDRR